MCLVTGERNWGSGVFLKCILEAVRGDFTSFSGTFELKNIPVSCNLAQQAGLKGHSLSFLLPFLFSKHSSAWLSSPTQHWLQHNNCNMLLFCLCWWDLSVVVVSFPSETCHFSKKTWTGNFFLSLFPCTLLGLMPSLEKCCFFLLLPCFKGCLGWEQCLKLCAEAPGSAGGHTWCEGCTFLLSLQKLHSVSGCLFSCKVGFLKSFSGNCGEAKNGS